MLFDGVLDIFDCGGKKKVEVDEEMVWLLYVKIGELVVVNDFLL